MNIQAEHIAGMGERLYKICYNSSVSERKSNAMNSCLVTIVLVSHPVVAQLFGINLNSPALVFHDDLVPMGHFWTQYRHSSLAITYLHYRIVGFPYLQAVAIPY